MARKLKTYQTSLGFFDLAIAAPSMKAALEAWGADSNLFHQGAAKESDDPDVIEATMAAPGVVLKRPVGSNGPFREHAELPTDLVSGSSKKTAAVNRGSLPSAPTTMRRTGPPHLLSRRNRSDGSANVSRKRPSGRRSASAVSRRSTRRRVSWTRPVASTKKRPLTFNNSSRSLRKARGRRKHVGKRRVRTGLSPDSLDRVDP